MPAQLHLAKNTFALHLFLERLERLVNIVVAYEDLHLAACSFLVSGPHLLGTRGIGPRVNRCGEGAYTTGFTGGKTPRISRHEEESWPF